MFKKKKVEEVEEKEIAYWTLEDIKRKGNNLGIGETLTISNIPKRFPDDWCGDFIHDRNTFKPIGYVTVSTETSFNRTIWTFRKVAITAQEARERAEKAKEEKYQLVLKDIMWHIQRASDNGDNSVTLNRELDYINYAMRSKRLRTEVEDMGYIVFDIPDTKEILILWNV